MSLYVLINYTQTQGLFLKLFLLYNQIMTTLSELLPKRADFTIVFNNGKKRKIYLRPYTLRDEAFLQNLCDTPEKLQKFQMQEPELVSRVIWNQMEAESRKLFDDVLAIDDNGEKVELEGFQKFMEAFGGVEQFYSAFNALMKARGLNNIQNYSGSKKKTNPIKKLIMRLSSTQ